MGGSVLFGPGLTIGTRPPSETFFKGMGKMGKRIETGCRCNFTNTQISRNQQNPRVLKAEQKTELNDAASY